MSSLTHDGMVAPLFRHVDQRAIRIKWRKESNGQRGEETQHLF